MTGCCCFKHISCRVFCPPYGHSRGGSELVLLCVALLRDTHPLSLLMGLHLPHLGDNFNIIQNASDPFAMLKKKHVAISFHLVHEAITSGVVAPFRFQGKHNLSDTMTKQISAQPFLDHVWSVFGCRISIFKIIIICQRELELERRVGSPVGDGHRFALKEEVRQC
jgi:hypothetical protein